MTATANVSDCTVVNCSFNDHSQCGAAGITIGGGEDHASCATFIDTGIHGGLPKVLATVGACQRAECVHNNHLMCGAPEVHVGPGADNADCLTYEHAGGMAGGQMAGGAGGLAGGQAGAATGGEMAGGYGGPMPGEAGGPIPEETGGLAGGPDGEPTD